MMTVKLTPMDEKTFKEYYEQSLEDYAYEHVKAGNWKEDGALEKAKEQFKQLLPYGLATNEHFLFSILHDHNPIGILWLHIRSMGQQKQAFIFDIKLEEDQRGKGSGKETMNALDEYAKAEGITQVRLHVFAHNERAIALYKNMGYEMTDHHMLKDYRK